MEHTLKPCPFCGSKVKHLTKFDVVYCSNVECGLNYENGGGYTVEYWNHRPLEAELIEALIECENWIRNDEVSHGRDFSAGIHAREALKNAGEL